MKVTFVGLGEEQLAIGLLSAILKREGHETALVFNPALGDDRSFLDLPKLARVFDRTDRVIDEVVATCPDLVAFSVLTPTYQWSLSVAAAVKRRMDVSTIFGGVHPSAVPEICLENSCVDYVCVGEGEFALAQLVEQLPAPFDRPRAPIPNLWWRQGDQLVQGEASGFVQDLDALPFWDKELWDPHVRISDSWLTMSARGCPYRCTFCFNNFFAKLPGKGGGSYLRHRSIEHVMEELHWAKQRWNVGHVDFQDDIFTTDKTWLKEFLREYRREIDVPFNCLVHPRYVDGDMARWLKEAGCEHVQMGVQSADEEYKRVHLLRMEKEVHMSQSLEDLRAAGLPVKLDHILGLPGEPLSAQETARELYAEYGPQRVQSFWLTHLPAVELTRSAVESGDLTEEQYEDICRGTGGRFHSRNVAHAGDAQMYRRYELLFRALPLLPRPLRVRARIHHVPPLSARATDAVGFMLECVTAFRNWDFRSINYLKGYGHHLRRQVPELAIDILQRRKRIRHVPPDPDLSLLRRAEPSQSAPDTDSQRLELVIARSPRRTQPSN